MQDRSDLLDRHTLLLHGTPPGPMGLTVPRNSLWKWSKNTEPPAYLNVTLAVPSRSFP
jgi:hypothetical protein